MQAIGINGSPRKSWNTAILLRKALAGAKSKGAKTEFVHLYDLSYKGCISCFSCKKIGGRSYGRCAVKDELTPVLKRIAEAQVLILGSPLYFHTESGEMRSFMERLLFPYVTYTPERACIFPGETRTALIYTMNVSEENMAAYHQDVSVAASRGVMTRVFGNCEALLSTDTLQFWIIRNMSRPSLTRSPKPGDMRRSSPGIASGRMRWERDLSWGPWSSCY